MYLSNGFPAQILGVVGSFAYELGHGVLHGAIGVGSRWCCHFFRLLSSFNVLFEGFLDCQLARADVRGLVIQADLIEGHQLHHRCWLRRLLLTQTEVGGDHLLLHVLADGRRRLVKAGLVPLWELGLACCLLVEEAVGGSVFDMAWKSC